MNLSDYIPYMNDTEIVHLMRYINKNNEVLEIGGGHSTIFLSKFVKRLVTIEHNKEWGKTINTILRENNIITEIRIIEPDFPQSHPFQPAQPNQFDSYINYLSSLQEMFDVILIDGRDRVRATNALVKNVKEGGYLIIHDFWNRPKYHSVLSLNGLELVIEKNSHLTDKIEDTLVVLKKVKTN